MEQVYVFLADGFEEIEGLTVVDILRRAGIEVQTVSIMGRKEIYGSHKITVMADCLLEDADLSGAKVLVLPGGLKGTENLEKCTPLLEALKQAAGDGRRVAAICAAPRVLAGLELLDGKDAVVHPSMESHLTNAKLLKVPTVTDGMITTGRGMGAAIDFSLELVRLLAGQEKVDEVAAGIVYCK
ncbi:MAG: DJ-1 family glyoxalase III [Blautia sp.]